MDRKLTPGEIKRQKKMQPKLRVFKNSETEVNSIRAERSSGITVTDSVLNEIKCMRSSGANPLELTYKKFPTKKSQKEIKLTESIVNVFVELDDSQNIPRKILGETSRIGNIATAKIRLKQVSDILKDQNVLYVSVGDTVSIPPPIINSESVGRPSSSSRRIPLSKNHKYGKDVIIGIIDVGGFDFAHPDFLDQKGNNTRFIRIWDQGGKIRNTPKQNKGSRKYDYGTEFTQDHLNNAIKATRNGSVPVDPVDIEPQSQMSKDSHGTHVASIAAGNFGVCPKAKIAAVLLELSDEDNDRRKSFYDSTRIAHAIEYLIEVSQETSKDKKKNVPISINISLGTNGHAHDSSSPLNRWIDNTLSVPGRSISVAAGNAGQESSEEEDDIGHIMGRIHTSGRIEAKGLDKDIEWIIVGNKKIDLSENELEIWYEPQDRFSISVKPPGMGWIGPIEPTEFIENRQLRDGSFLSIYNELYHPSNGNNYISVYLSPLYSQQRLVGIKSGTWIVRLHGMDVRDGRYDAWIERDDPRPIGLFDDKEVWFFPSYFSERSNVDKSSISTLACGHRVISVANLDELNNKINITSSQGPTRDGRPKPDVCAAGTNITAASGFNSPSERWVSMTGTSMASPYVTGVIGLMMNAIIDKPQLSAAQINGILRKTAQPLPGMSYQWKNDTGFGAIDPKKCIIEALKVYERKDVT